ncbi:hypothetical protein H7D62_016390, partial [Brucella melitensis]|nr:hypothetical protein [Brucella melitensis]
MQQNDPMRALQAQKLQLEMDALRAKPQTEYGFTTLPDGTVLRIKNSIPDQAGKRSTFLAGLLFQGLLFFGENPDQNIIGHGSI